MPTLQDIYLAYLDCLNRQAFDELGAFVDDIVEHNIRFGADQISFTTFTDQIELQTGMFLAQSSKTRQHQMSKHDGGCRNADKAGQGIDPRRGPA